MSWRERIRRWWHGLRLARSVQVGTIDPKTGVKEISKVVKPGLVVVMVVGLLSCRFIPPYTDPCDSCKGWPTEQEKADCRVRNHCDMPLPTASPTSSLTPSPTTTATISPTTSPTETAQPTVAPALLPPTLDFYNGCGNVQVDGKCEFTPWFKVDLPADRLRPPCTPEQCPSVWWPSGMGKTCDHMFTEPNASAGVYEPRAGRWVSIMWYVCGGRKWDDPRGPRLITTGTVTCQQPGYRPDDLFNATCSGTGTITFCAWPDLFACKDPADYLDPSTYRPPDPHCQSGAVSVPGAVGSCRTVTL